MNTLSGAPFVARTPEQARLLLDLSYFKPLGRVMRGETSAGEVARATGLSLKQTHHKLTRLLHAGLVEVCAERQRGGRPVKVYRAVAPQYRVPFALTDAATMGELVSRMQQPMLAQHYRTVGEIVLCRTSGDILLELTDRGELSAGIRSGPAQAAEAFAISTFTQVRLSRETVQELETRLKDLTAWLSAEALDDPTKGEPYTFGLMLTPGQLRER